MGTVVSESQVAEWRKRPFWDEEMWSFMRLSLEEQEQARLTKLKRQLKYCYDNSAWYRNWFHSVDMVLEKVRTWADFQRLPLFTKDDERRSQEESLEKYGHPWGMHLCCPPEKLLAVASTSGTTGTPTFMYSNTMHDVRINTLMTQRMFWLVGIKPGDTILHCTGLSMYATGALGFHSFISLGVRCVPVGAEAGTERILLMAKLVRPDVMTATPSLALHLIERAPKVLGADVDSLGVKKILCYGEPGAGLMEIRRRLENAYGAKIYDVSAGNYATARVSCDAAQYQGMHDLGEDYLVHIADLTDPQTKQGMAVADGAIGLCPYTHLDQEARPAVRYDLGDLHQVYTEPCVCGMPGRRMKFLGRTDDMLIVKGVNVYPTAVKDLVNSFVPRVTGEMRIVLDAPPPRVEPPLKMKVEYGPDVPEDELPRMKAEIEERMHSGLKFRPQIELVPPFSLPRAATKGQMFERRYQQQS